MGRQDLIDHIEQEISGDTNWSNDEESQPVFCQECGELIASRTEMDATETDYVVHRIPTQEGNGVENVFYCSSGCFKESMDDLFAPVDDAGF